MVLTPENESEECWARLRFVIVGPLLAAPPAKGQLREQLRGLAQKQWTHPVTEAPTSFGVSTIERWYYRALKAPTDPVAALRRKKRYDRGHFRAMPLSLTQLLEQQYQRHPGWSYLLHAQNLAVVVENEPVTMPSYATVRRFMRKKGWLKKRRRRGPRSPSINPPVESREVRSFEAEYVHGLWHLDFHQGSLQVLLPSGEWIKPQLFAVMDDCSRLGCHLQWYLSETAENLVHGLTQGILKRGLPRALLSDNGSAMIADETRRGLLRLGIPEIQQTPLERFLDEPSVGRDAPDIETLRQAFCTETTRKQRRSDGTLTLEGVRFEVPNRFRHVEHLHLRYARWDLSHVDLIEESEGQILARIFPIDKVRNADARRRSVEPREAAEQEKSCSPLPPARRHRNSTKSSFLNSLRPPGNPAERPPGHETHIPGLLGARPPASRLPKAQVPHLDPARPPPRRSPRHLETEHSQSHRPVPYPPRRQPPSLRRFQIQEPLAMFHRM